MENSNRSGLEEQLEKAERFCKLVQLRSEAFVHGAQWVKSRLADLKIDLWLATEQGEDGETEQVNEIHHQIDILQTSLEPSIFDPKPEDAGILSMQSAAADLALFAIHIAKQQMSMADTTDFSVVLQHAKDFLKTDEARSEAHSCMERILERPGVLFEDVQEVLERAQSLLVTLS
jgi:hypothetical protein